MIEYLDIGKIANTHGIRGELKVVPLTDDSERYEDLKWVYVDKNGALEKYNIESIKYFKSFVILKFKEIPDMTAAEMLKGLVIKIDRSKAVKLPEDTFFICDLIGIEVFDERDRSLGHIRNVFQTGSNDVYVVKRENEKELLIPALKSVVREVSINDKKMLVTLPKGLVEDEV